MLDNYIAELHLELGNAYVALSGVPYDGHDGDCCVKNAPHYKPEPCCCGAAERAKQPRG